MYLFIEPLTIVDVLGNDALAILNNLCTAEIKPLTSGQGLETFVTEVRGRTVAHAMLYKTEHGLRLIGAAGQADRLVAHIDRYIIREDAQPVDVSEQYCAALITGDDAQRLSTAWDLSPAEPPRLAAVALTQRLAGLTVYQVPWTSAADWLCVAPQAAREELQTALDSMQLQPGDATAFHLRRIEAGFPWFGADLDESNLPQEADRNRLAISFTKGCYLGQETVARLDALGQVQKKLVRWKIDTTEPIAAGTALTSQDKNVGKITSSARRDDHTIALGFARRSHFDAGSAADCDGHAASVVA